MNDKQREEVTEALADMEWAVMRLLDGGWTVVRIQEHVQEIEEDTRPDREKG
jgi:hypothetical protein